MSPFKLLDVTFRDGGHLNDFHVEESHLSQILTALEASGIDYAEVGYRNGAISPIANIGKAGLCLEPYLEDCQRYLSHTKMAVMAHCKNIVKEDLQSLKDHGVTLVRLCIEKGQHEKSFAFIEAAKEIGLEVSANLIHISQYEVSEVYKVVEQLLRFQPNLIYFADSNGCMHPHRVKELYQHCTTHYKTVFGFHAHNNIGLAQTNTLASLLGGAQFIDASLGGAGKGIGNLRLEFIVAYLHSVQEYRYELDPLIEASNAILTWFPECGKVSKGEFLRGILDLSTKQMKEYLENAKKGALE